MKRVLLSILFSAIAFSQVTPDCQQSLSISSSGAQSVIDNRTRGCLAWRLTYSTLNTTAITISIQGSTSQNGVYTDLSATPIEGTNPDSTNPIDTVNIRQFYPWIRINVSTLTGSNSSVTYTLYGYKGTTSATNTVGGSSLTCTSGQIVTGTGQCSQAIADTSGNGSFLSINTGASPPSVTAGTGGIWSGKEGTAPTVGCPGVGVDCIYYDATAHAPLLSVNNGPFLPIGGVFNQSNLANRNPTQNDDLAHGITASMYWINQTTGDTWQNQTTTNGLASWSRVTPTFGLPLDVAGTNIVAAYGIRLLSVSYTGACCTIIRTSDSTTQVLNFVNGYVDTATAGKFCSGTICKLTTWNDQSGNARNCTQATIANAPYFAINTLGNGVTVSFWTSVTANAPVSVPTYCALPSGVAATAPNYSFVIVGQGRNGNGGEFISLGPTTSNELDFEYIQSNNITVLSSPIPFYGGTASTLPMEGTPAVFVASSNSTNVNYWINETNITGTKSAVAQAFTGGNLGFESAGSTPLYGDMSAAFVYSANINSSRQALSNSLYRLFGVTPQVSMNTVVEDGDSIINGTGAQSLVNFAVLAQKQTPTRLVETGTTGITCATLDSRFSTNIAPLFPSYGRNKIYQILCGTNDLAASVSAATIWGHIQSIMGKAAAVGFTAISSTVLPCNGCDETQRGLLNASIRSGAVAAGATLVCDYAADPNMGQAGDNTNATYFLNPDDTHPNDFGNTILAQYLLACIQPLLSR